MCMTFTLQAMRCRRHRAFTIMNDAGNSGCRRVGQRDVGSTSATSSPRRRQVETTRGSLEVRKRSRR